MKPFHFVIPLLLWSTLKPALAQRPDAGSLFPRQYKIGDKYKYQLTTEQIYNGKWNSTTIVTIELTVVNDSGDIPFDEVRHLSKIVYTPQDTVDKTAEARAVAPYRISLHPRGTLVIPPIKVPGMTGAVTDFITFFVAISPLSGVTTLTQKGDSIIKKEPVKGNFANGKTILFGEDCLMMSARIMVITNKDVSIRTDFQPPATPCLTYLLSDLQIPVIKGILNNFQMVMPAGNNKVNIQYGNEMFYINSLVSRTDGKIQKAEMFNMLQLALRLNCDQQYGNCQSEMPFTIQRNLKLERLQ